MSRPSSADEPITSRTAFEAALRDLLAVARNNDVHIQGAYETRRGGDRQLNVEITELTPPSRLQRTARATHTGPIDLGSTDVTTRTSLVQVLTGLRLAPDGHSAACADCGVDLVDGASITGVAANPLEGFRWSLGDLRCEACPVSELRSPTFGRTEALVRATVSEALSASKQCGWQIASDVTVLDYSPPSEGSTCR